MPSMPVRFELRRSRTLALWLAAVHGGGVIAVWGSALPAAAAGVLSAFAAASFVRGLRLHALRSAPDAVVRVALEPEVRLGLADGRTCRAALRARPFLHPRLVVLRLDSDVGRTVVLVPPDSLSPRALHKALRRRLRHGGVS